MSTRCQIMFRNDDETDAEARRIYRHSDGYPDTEHGVVNSLAQFFKAVADQTQDTRFEEAEYLAAKFIVWQASVFARDKDKPLDFLSLGVANGLHGDEEYEYRVVCRHNALPEVTYRKTRGGNSDKWLGTRKIREMADKID